MNQDSLGIQGQCVKVALSWSRDLINYWMTCSGLLLTRLYRRPHLALLLRILCALLASVGWAPDGGQLGRGDSQQIRQGGVHHYGLARGRSHTPGDILSPGIQGASITIEAYGHCQDLWSGDMLPDIVVGGEEWEGARWYGIVAAHDNRSYKLTPVMQHEER